MSSWKHGDDVLAVVSAEESHNSMLALAPTRDVTGAAIVQTRLLSSYYDWTIELE